MGSVPTIAVHSPNGGRMVINESDFDESVHELWEDDAPADAATTTQSEPTPGDDTPNDSAPSETPTENDDKPTKSEINKASKAGLKEMLKNADLSWDRSDTVPALQDKVRKHFYPE